MKTKPIIATVVFIFLFASCNTNADKAVFESTVSNPDQATPQQNNKQPQIPVGTLQTALPDSGTTPPTAKAASNIDWDKKIIKTATLKLEVKDFKGYNNNIHQTIKQFGGYIAHEQQNLSEEKSETVIAIKVPVEQFETLMNQLPGGDNKILEKLISTEDVTGEMVDTRSRLEARKVMRLKYLEFLKQSKNMEEVLQVQNQVNGIQEEIESAAGRVEFLSHQSLFSTINLTFFQALPGYKPVDETPTFFTRTAHAFKNGVSWIADLFVGLVSIWPLLLVIIGIYIGWKKIKPEKKTTINA